MRRQIYQLLAAGILVLTASAVVAGPALAQAEREGAPEAATPDAQARSNAAPSPQDRQQPPDGVNPEEPDVQQSCPDQRRPLQLIV